MSPRDADWSHFLHQIGLVGNQSIDENLSPLLNHSRYLQNTGVASLAASIMAGQDSNTPPPWQAAYPVPKTTASSISKQDVLQFLEAGAIPGKDILLVDLRRSDHEVKNSCGTLSRLLLTVQGGTIRGSINLPAQSLHPSIATVYQLVKAAGVPRVIWYCGETTQVLTMASRYLPAHFVSPGSSRGRGPRAAAWFADHLMYLQEPDVQSLTLEGGIKGWVEGGPEFIHWMDEYDESQWSTKVI